MVHTFFKKNYIRLLHTWLFEVCQGILVLSTIKNRNHPQGLSGLFTCDLHVNRPDSTFTNYSLAPSCLLYVGKYLVIPSFAEEIPTLPLQSFLWLRNFKIKKKKKRDTRLHFSINPQMVVMMAPWRKDMNHNLHKSNSISKHIWEVFNESACPHTAIHVS